MLAYDNLLALPKEILISIFQFFDSRTLCICFLLSKYSRSISDDIMVAKKSEINHRIVPLKTNTEKYTYTEFSRFFNTALNKQHQNEIINDYDPIFYEKAGRLLAQVHEYLPKPKKQSKPEEIKFTVEQGINNLKKLIENKDEQLLELKKYKNVVFQEITTLITIFDEFKSFCHKGLNLN